MLRLPEWTAPCLLLACAGCASETTFHITLRYGTDARLEVLGNNPFVQIDNRGPGEAEVTFRCGTDRTDTTRLPTASIARTLPGGGTVRLSLALGSTADVHVLVQNAPGTALDYGDRGTAPR